MMPGRPGVYTLESTEAPGRGWNEALLRGRTDSLRLYHSTHWADRLRELLGYRPIYLSLLENGMLRLRMVGFVCAPAPLPPEADLVRRAKRVVRRAVDRLGRHESFTWYGQPVCFEAGPATYAALATELSAFLRQHGLRLAGGEWPCSQAEALPPRWRATPWATLKIDLTQDIDAIRSRLKPSARKEINKARARGIVVKQVATLDELRVYHAFARECAKRYGKEMLGFEDYETMWRHFRGWGHFETFVAYHAGETIAGLSVWGDPVAVAEIGSFQSQHAYEHKLGGADAVKWEAIRWAKTVNAASFDLSGVNPAPRSRKEETIKRFKQKWSDREYDYLILGTKRLYFGF